ncbi:MAG TPA: T9SS type A sorting domain-containing protein [Ignavibacteria bacterium]|nr:T9SS type A sorting domain-containing protein [Ignavibacteria bacterium]
MKTYLKVLFGLLFFAFSVKNCLPQAAVDWYNIYSGPKNIAFESEQVVSDDSGNVYVTGTAISGPYSDKTAYLDIVTVKYGPSGNIIWQKSYFSSGSAEDYPQSLTLDRYSNVYVTGNIFDTVSNVYSHVTLKYSPGGNLLWAAKQQNAYLGDVYRKGLVLDSSLNVYVFCRDLNYSYLIKYNSSGDSLWKYKTTDQIIGSMSDKDNNILIADLHGIRKLNNEGNLVWQKTMSGVFNYADIMGDEYGNYYFCGNKLDSIVFCKISNTGDVVWTKKIKRYNQTNYNFYGDQRCLITKDGNIVIASQNPLGSYSEMFLNKYNPDGDLLWSLRYSLSDTSIQVLHELKEDSRGFLYAYGYSRKANNPINANDYFVILKIKPNGNIIRTTRFGTLPTYSGFPKSFTVGKDFKMYVALTDYITENHFYYKTIFVKYSQPYDTLFIPVTVPTGYDLMQNYPNPFNLTTKSKFRNPKYTHVLLTVYDALGRKVADLIDDNIQSDWHTYTWEAAGLSSGLYFYRLTAGDFSETKKMVLIK